jgi:hypothetical protein
VDNCFLRRVTSVSNLVIWFSLTFNSLSFSDREVCSISVSFCKFSMIDWFGVGVLAAFSVVFVFCVIPICVGWYGCFCRVTLLADSTLSPLAVGVLTDCELGWLICFSTCSGLDRMLYSKVWSRAISFSVISIPLLTAMITSWLVCSFFASHGIVLISTQNTDIACT